MPTRQYRRAVYRPRRHDGEEWTGELLLLGGELTEILTYTGLTFGPAAAGLPLAPAPGPVSPTHLTNNLTYA